MTVERLQQLIEAYGADSRRWPEAEREAGRALLATQPHQASAIEAARDLDHLLCGNLYFYIHHSKRIPRYGGIKTIKKSLSEVQTPDRDFL